MLSRLPMIGCVAAVCLFITAPVDAQTAAKTAQNHSWADDCTFEKDKIVCSVKEDSPQAIGPLQVPNSSVVVIRVTNKSPFDDCTLGDIKTAEIKPPDPIVTILQLLTKSITGAALPSSFKDPGATVSGKSQSQRTPADNLYMDLKKMQKTIDDEIAEAGKLVSRNGDAAQNADKLFSNPPRTKADYDAPATATRISVADLRQSLNDLLGEGEPSVESESVHQGLLRDRLKDILAKGPQDPTDVDTIPADEVLFDNLSGKIAALKANYDAVSAAHIQFRALSTFFDQVDTLVKTAGKNPFQKDVLILPFVQQTATTSVSCSNSFSKKTTSPQIPVTVMYQKDPRLSVSVGPLLSTIEKQKLGTTPISTGVDSSGKPTFKSVFAVVDHAPVQVVPFAFLNYRLLDFSGKTNPAKKKSVSLNLSLGVGVNPNSGTNEPEFFVGPSIGFKKLMVQFGDHIGRFQDGFSGGFNIGDTVPANFPSTLPIHKVYRNGFGIALSYRLPL